MQLSNQKFRLYEFIFIFLAVTYYVVRRLLGFAHHFDDSIWLAESSHVTNAIIWADLADYNQYLNTIFPVIAAAVLFVGAWAVFHYLVFPRFSNGQWNTPTLLFAILTVLLVVVSAFVFHYFKLYWEFQYDFQGRINGLRLYSGFRKLHVVTHAFSGLLIIGLYELITQAYYFTANLYQLQKQAKHLLLAASIVLFTVLGILYWIIFSDLDADIISERWLVLIVFMVLFSGAIHWAFFQLVIPFFINLGGTVFEKYTFRLLGVLVYLFIGVLSYGFIRNYLHWSTRWHLYLFVLPSVLGIGSAIIRWFFFVENQQLQRRFFNQSAELSTLRSQINPHFLFNSLNTLFAVALQENAEKTSNGIQKLGDMMRFMLHENHQERIPLSKEVEYLQNYIDLQRMRLDESQNIEIRVNLQQPDREIYLAPMLLNPFVENAFKHGISFRQPSWIYITLTLDSQKLYFKVHNSVQANQNDIEEQEASGVGLENVKKRLELIYPNRYTLEIQQSEQDYFASLVLTYW